MQKRLFSNAIWNVVNGSSSALVAVVVPPFLTRALGPEAYGAWALALQIGTYVALFGFGIQMAVGRYVAHSEARHDFATRDGIVSTAFWFLAFASLIAWIAICGVGFLIHKIVPNLSLALVAETRWAILLVGLALAINLPASIFAAVFTGMLRSEVPAKIQGSGRILQAIALIAVAPFQSLAMLGLVYALIALGTVAALWHAWRNLTHAPTLSRSHIDRIHGKELFSFCVSLTLWNLSMLLVSGLDLIIVGRFDYRSTAFFAVSVTLVTLVNGTLSSLANALVPAAASLPDDDNGEGLRTLLSRASRLIIGASVLAGAPLLYQGHVILEYWLGHSYALHGARILSILALATMIRNALLPYVTLAIGIGYQRKMIVTPLLEGTITIAVSLLLARYWGAQGVALAKIVGGMSGISLLLAQHPLRDRIAGLSLFDFFIGSVLSPAAALIPAGILTYLMEHTPGVQFPGLATLTLVGIVTALSVWFWSLDAVDRRFAYDLITRRNERLSKGA